jgi:hypothetical protein
MRVPGRQGLQGKIRFSASSVDADELFRPFAARVWCVVF